ATLLIGCYELSGPVLYRFDDSGAFALSMTLYNYAATPEFLDLHVELIAQFLFFFLAAYLGTTLITKRVLSWKPESLFSTEESLASGRPNRLNVLLGALFVFGAISVYQD